MLKNISSNWALSVVQILVFMVISPFVVNALGKDVNGVWVSIVSLTGFLQLLILGVPMASVRYIAEHVARGDKQRTNEAVATCFGICLFMGFVALLVGAALYHVFESQYLTSGRWESIGPETVRDARIAFAVVVLTVTVGFAAQLPYGIFNAHHDFVVRNLVMGGGFVLKLGLTILLLSIEASLFYLATVQVVCIAAEFTVASVIVKKRYAGLKLGIAGFNRKMMGGILSFSVFAMLLNVGSKLAFQADALVIGWFMDTDQVTIYDIAFKVFDPFTNLILAIDMVVMPIAIVMNTRGERAELQALFLKWTKVCVSLVLLIGCFLLVFGPEFLNWWFRGEDVTASGPLLQVIMVSFLIFLPVRGVAMPILMSLGRPGRPALALLFMGILNVSLSIALIGPYGLLGVALGTAIPNVLFAIAVLGFACAELDVRPTRLLGYAAVRACLGALLPLALLLILKFALELEGFFELLAAGLGYTALFGVLWVFFVYRGDPYFDLREKLMRRLGPVPDREPPA